MSRNPRYEGELPPEQLTWHLDPNTDPALKKGAGGCLVIPAALGTAALIGLGTASSLEVAAPTSEIITEEAPSNELFEDNTITIYI